MLRNNRRSTEKMQELNTSILLVSALSWYRQSFGRGESEEKTQSDFTASEKDW
jgi:hypothetical protein